MFDYKIDVEFLCNSNCRYDVHRLCARRHKAELALLTGIEFFTPKSRGPFLTFAASLFITPIEYLSIAAIPIGVIRIIKAAVDVLFWPITKSNLHSNGRSQ